MDIRTANRNPEYPEYKNIPGQTLDDLAYYLEKGTPPGGFLTKVLENDLMKAMEKADLDNKRALPALARLLFNHVPGGAYGSPAKVNQWILEKNPQRIPDRIDSLFELRRTAERFSDPDKIEPFMGEDAESTIGNIADAVMNRIDDPLMIAASDETAKDFFFSQEVWPGEMPDNGFSAASVFRLVLRRSVETQISEKVTAHVAKTLWVGEEETAGPGI